MPDRSRRARPRRTLAAPTALALATLAAAATGARGEEPAREDVMRELQALRAKVERLEAAQRAREDRPTAREVDATVERVLRDADRRSQLLQAQGFTAGWTGGKFVVQSEDQSFVLSPQLWLQARYVANYREEDADDPVDGDATTESGFELRRVKFIVDGNAFGPRLKYKFQLNVNRGNGNAFLEDAFVSYKLNDLLTVRGGQYKEPTFHEELVSDTRQMSVERSLVNFVLGGGNTDRVQGVALVIDDGPQGSPLRGEVGFTDGPNSDNTNFQDAGGSAFFGVAGPDFGLYARGEYLLLGDWKNYEDFTALGTTRPLLVAGAGASYAQAGDAGALFHTVDVQYEQEKLGLYAAYYGVYADGAGRAEDDGDDPAAGDGDSFYDAGVLAQAGYLLTKKWEAFGRYEYIKLDDERGPDADDHYHVIAGGVNYYFRGHAAKFTLDVSYLPNGSPVNADGLGILDPDGDAEQVVFRGQFQLLI